MFIMWEKKDLSKLKVAPMNISRSAENEEEGAQIHTPIYDQITDANGFPNCLQSVSCNAENEEEGAKIHTPMIKLRSAENNSSMYCI